MTTCLIIPPSPFLLDERVFVSLGILKVASALIEVGEDVELLDLSGVKDYIELARHHAWNSPANFFGITSTTPQYPAVRRIARAIRNARPDARTVLGGPHPTLISAAVKREIASLNFGRASEAMSNLLQDRDQDTGHLTWTDVVAGDGEKAMVALVQKAIKAASKGTKVTDADNPENHNLFLSKEELSEAPLPARHLIDLKSYHYTIDSENATSLIAQLGCPFACHFCGGRFSPMLRKTRQRSHESVIAEIEHLHRTYSYKGFMFYDDELNVNPLFFSLLKDLRHLQERLGVEFRLRGFVKSELLTEKQAQAMYEAGFRWALIGFESASPQMLRNMNKRAKVDDNTRALHIAREAGLKVKALMSIGHPGEREETCSETRTWLMKEAPDDFDVTVITTYPGTPYYDDAELNPVLTEEHRHNIWTYTANTSDRLHAIEIDYNQTADYYKGIPGEYKSYIFTDFLNREEITAIRDDIESSVRKFCNIPWNAQQSPATKYEHSMGQSLPPSVLRSSGQMLEAARK